MKYRPKEPAGKKTEQRILIAESLKVEVGKLIDGIRYLHMGQIINIALSEWLEREKRLNARKKQPPPDNGTQ